MELSKTRKHVGEKFGELEILEQYSDNRKTKVLCKCNRCGETTIKRYDYIKDKKDCGCSKLMNKYKNFDKRLYQRWKGMKARCTNPNHISYNNYGGRGIDVSQEWKEDYKNFYKDMIDSYFEGAELDRIDNNGDYSKENCHWVTRESNVNNRRTYEEIGNYQSESGFPGVYYRNKVGKYEAYAMYKGDRKYLGLYKNKEDAIASRKKYLNETYGIYE